MRLEVAGEGAGASCLTSPFPVLLAMGSTVVSRAGIPERWTGADWPGRWITVRAPGSGSDLGGA